jgi:hypothetical protein
MTSLLRASQIMSTALRRFQQKLVGYLTPHGRVFCPACANRRGVVAASDPYYADDWTDWSITCEDCQETILEPDDEREEDQH